MGILFCPDSAPLFQLGRYTFSMTTLTGKQIIVTGATSGIGEQTAFGLAQLGAGITLISRSAQKLKDTQQRIQTETGNNQIDYIVADFSSIEAVRTAAELYLARHKRLDVLVNNAGAAFRGRRESADGIELTLAVNHIAPFVLTNALLALLKETAAANPDWGTRVVHVSSAAHTQGVNWDDPQFEKKYSTMPAYGQSKAFNVLFSNALARRLAGTGVTSNSLHPGVVNTNIGQSDNGWLAGKLFKLVFAIIGTSPKNGAETSVYLASSPEVAGVTGQYFDDSKARKPKSEMLDEAKQEQLWQLTEGWIGS